MTIDPAEWHSLSTAEVSDAMDALGIPGQLHGIAALDRSVRLTGPAFTVRYGPIGHGGGTVGDYVDDVPKGAVVVLDNRGRTDATVWDDLLTSTAHLAGLGGTVIDGVCRDTDRALALRYPIYARGHWMRTGKDRVRVEQIQGPVSCGGVRIEPGDLLLGDADGVLAIPAARATKVLDRARAIAAAERAIRERRVRWLPTRRPRRSRLPHAALAREYPQWTTEPSGQPVTAPCWSSLPTPTRPGEHTRT